MYKVLRTSFLLGLLLRTVAAFGQEDSLPYRLYNQKLVLYSDLGFNTAPIGIKYPYNDEIKRLRYRNNSNMVLGFGFSYKWMAARLGINLPVSLRSSRYGKTSYFDLGFDFTLKRVFLDFDFHLYQGYVIKNGYRWNDTLNDLYPHEQRPDVNSASFSINAWVFRSKDFKMAAMRGKTGSYEKDVKTWYFRYTLNIHGVSSEINASLVPVPLQDSSQSKTLSHVFTALDFGLIPGYAYVKRWKNFQIGGMAGLGLVIQSKFYTFEDQTRGFLGLAPRLDLKFIAGYNQPKYFLMFVTDFDNKSIRFQNLSYRQTYYSLRLVGGIRLDVRKKNQKIIND